MDCDYFREEEVAYNYQYFELKSIENAKSLDYKAKLRVFVVGKNEAHIDLSEDKDRRMGYSIGMFLLTLYSNEQKGSD